MQKALGLSFLSPSQAGERKIAIEGSDYLVRLLELPLDDVDIDDDDLTVSWPETIEDKMLPKIDGALTLYNVKDKGSLENIPEMLSECFHAMGTIEDAISILVRSISYLWKATNIYLL